MSYYLSDEDFKEAEANGIPGKIAYHRFYILNWSRERTVAEPYNKYNKDWKEWQDVAVVSQATFYRRTRKGMAPEEAAMTPPSPKHPNPKVTKEDMALAAEKGMALSTFLRRVYHQKMSIEEAISTPLLYERKSLRRKAL